MHRMRSTLGFTLVDAVVLVIIIATLAAILFPVFVGGKSWGKKSVGPLQLRDADLDTVFRRLHAQLYPKSRHKEPRWYRWDDPRFKTRRVTLVNSKRRTISSVFRDIEAQTGLKMIYGGCGTCGGLDGPVKITDPTRRSRLAPVSIPSLEGESTRLRR
jgi:hypothetical protein